ncbi:hypothetical protein IQ255_17675 [Pleurocapsales cyanobacterium LEGE 10410]|nr:hypothetical protein [Pleurocapsales cyanobacterium LEGE 10410]
MLGVHESGNQFFNSGVLITKDIYDNIINQIEADLGTTNADQLPENAIIGSEPGLFSRITQILHLIRQKSKPLSFNQCLTVSN